MTIRVTAEDLSGNDPPETQEIDDDYVLICAGKCEVTNIQVHANGTHVITIRGSKGRP